MIEIARTCCMLWKQRWIAVRDDEGASSVEYVLLVLLGVAVAALVTAAVTAAVTSENNQLPGQ